MTVPTLEICVDDVAGLRVAQCAGVSRIELCSALGLGGLTPSVGLMRMAAGSSVPVYAMIRPREGDFVFSSGDVAQMVEDIAAARDAGLAGVVLGASCEGGSLDMAVLERLVRASEGMGRTLHRVFDLVPDVCVALDQAVSLSFERILTSGRGVTALDGAEVLRGLVERAAGRIEIMAGSGVRAESVRALMAMTGVRSVHASCRVRGESEGRGAALGFGDGVLRTDGQAIERLLGVLKE